MLRLYILKLHPYLALSSFTHLRGPLATTVAALGLSSSKAISPKNKKLTFTLIQSMQH